LAALKRTLKLRSFVRKTAFLSQNVTFLRHFVQRLKTAPKLTFDQAWRGLAILTC